MKLKKTKKGFTLIELIVVVVVLAILAAVAVPMISSWVATAEANAAEANARTISLAVKATLATEAVEAIADLDAAEYGASSQDKLDKIVEDFDISSASLNKIKYRYDVTDKGNVTPEKDSASPGAIIAL